MELNQEVNVATAQVRAIVRPTQKFVDQGWSMLLKAQHQNDIVVWLQLATTFAEDFAKGRLDHEQTQQFMVVAPQKASDLFVDTINLFDDEMAKVCDGIFHSIIRDLEKVSDLENRTKREKLVLNLFMRAHKCGALRGNVVRRFLTTAIEAGVVWRLRQELGLPQVLKTETSPLRSGRKTETPEERRAREVKKTVLRAKRLENSPAKGASTGGGKQSAGKGKKK